MGNAGLWLGLCGLGASGRHCRIAPAREYAARVLVPRQAWWLSIVVLFGFLAVQVTFASHAEVHPDTARYAALAWQYQGVPATTAERRAIALMCKSRDDPPSCLAQQGSRLEPTSSPRYQAFFSTRPGYPFMVSVLVSVLGGMKAALWAVPVGATALAGLVVAWLVRLAGASPRSALLGQVLLYAAPTGRWGVQMLTEGPILLGVLFAVAGTVLLARHHLVTGAAACAAGLVLLALVKYSTAIALGAALAAVALVAAALVASGCACASWPGLAVVTGLGVTCAVALLGLSRARGWPGIDDTVQDMFTDHFARPDLPDFAGRLVEANHAYWVWFVTQPATGLLIVGTVVAAWAMWRADRVLALFVLAAATTGLTVVIHPDPTQLDRLYVLLWLATIVGLPLAGAASRPMRGWAHPKAASHRC